MNPILALIPESLKQALIERAKLEGAWSAAQERADDRIADAAWEWLVASDPPILEEAAEAADAAQAAALDGGADGLDHLRLCGLPRPPAEGARPGRVRQARRGHAQVWLIERRLNRHAPQRCGTPTSPRAGRRKASRSAGPAWFISKKGGQLHG